jgi:hypothetical protein
MATRMLTATQSKNNIKRMTFSLVRGLEEIGDGRVAAIAVEPAEEKAAEALEDLENIAEG